MTSTISHHATRTSGATQLVRVCLWLSVIVAGLALRQFGPGLGLSFAPVKYGGSILWGTMVFCVVAIVTSDLSREKIALIAVGAAKLSDAIADLRSAFTPPLDVSGSGDLDTPMRISEENATIIFSNLADNALRHRGSTLEISAMRQGSSLLVKVCDDGEGVSPNNRRQIFDSFFTTRRDSGGTGMGLAIVRAMLDAHGGAIRLLDSERGTAFELTIPVADGPQP